MQVSSATVVVRCVGSNISVWPPRGEEQRERNELNCGLRSCLWERTEPLWSQHSSGSASGTKCASARLPDLDGFIRTSVLYRAQSWVKVEVTVLGSRP